MEYWTEDQKKDFVYHYQSRQLKENDSNNFVKCQLKRQSMNILLQTAQTVTSNETTCLILKQKLNGYSAIVDKHDGVNNYANGVLDLVSHNSSDAQKWTSKAKASELIKEFLLPLPGECYNKSPEGCSAQRPSKAELEAFLKNKKPFPSFLSASNKPVMKLDIQKPSTSSGYTPSVGSEKPMNQLNRARVETGKRAHPESGIMNAIENRVFGSVKGGGFNQSSKQEVQAKPQSSSSFRTAGTELKLQNMKKYGNQANSGSGGDIHSYGSAKKSLGGRTRSVNNKFVPPVKEGMNSKPNSCEEEIEDEQLRLVDPKMVELIRSEIMDHGPPVGWNDIAGLHFAKATIQEVVVLPMLRPDIFTGLRRPPKGILLFGPPGTGKTLIGKCIASQSKSTFFNISASSLTSKWVGEGEKMVRTLFTLARIHQPAVVFIDEIDSLLSQRNETEHESSRRIKTEFLVQLDGAGTGEEDRILVIGATNRPQELDEAARRRLVKRLYIPLPDKQARSQIVQNLMSSERNVLTQQQVEEIASLTEGYSGADMKTVCQEACLGPIRAISFAEIQHIAPDQVRPVTVEDFKCALSCVRSSVSPRDLEAYVTWDQTYGSGGAPK